MKRNDLFAKLFEKWKGFSFDRIEQLPLSGSNREYYRIFSKNNSFIGTYNENIPENNSFIYLSSHFIKQNLPVPHILAVDESLTAYIQTDYGDISLFNFLQKNRVGDFLNPWLKDIYKKVINHLITFQVKTQQGIDYQQCFSGSEFNSQSMYFDLNYFKYYFVKLSGITFDEIQLDNDFKKLTEILTNDPPCYFMYRDFQSRNILLKDGEIYFIDYQGGRKGYLEYDLASLLFDGKADLPQSFRDEMLEYYISEISKQITIDEPKFRERFNCFVLLRIMQAMGAYGFRGYFEKKSHFLKSIPFGLKNIETVLKNNYIPLELSTLRNTFNELLSSQVIKEIIINTKLKVKIQSFSYRKGLPYDATGNGGGFIFDARVLPNPGKLEKYSKSTGKDLEVKEYIEKYKEVDDFMEHVYWIASNSIQKYIERGLQNLMISFGCTGGQHRSVYCAEKLKNYLETRFDIILEIQHRDTEYMML